MVAVGAALEMSLRETLSGDMAVMIYFVPLATSFIGICGPHFPLVLPRPLRQPSAVLTALEQWT